MKKFQKILVSLLVVVGLCSIVLPTVASAAPCPPGYVGDVCDSTRTVQDVLKIVINTMLFLLTAVAVIIIIISGFRMATSAGNADSMAKSRNSILYAAIGIVVAAGAYAIVNFVILRVTS